MAAREGRTRDANRALDNATRFRRQKKALEALEQDNFQDEPHADLVMSKKAPKFQENLDGASSSGPSKKKKSRTVEYYKQKYRKSIAQLIEEEQMLKPNGPNYLTAEAPPTNLPPRNFCTVCGFPAAYTCVQCGVKYCQIKCYSTHRDTRCLKWTA